MQPNKHRKPKVELYNKVYSLKAVHLVPSTLLLNDKHANLQSRLCLKSATTKQGQERKLFNYLSRGHVLPASS